MVAMSLWIAGSLIMLLLGSIHWYYTFFSNKFLPRKEELQAEMKETAMVLTRETTLWKAWVGFNASHSLGAIYIGIVNIFMAIGASGRSPANFFFSSFTILVIGFYLWLAKKYWFKIPFIGVSITLCLYILSAFITFTTG